MSSPHQPGFRRHVRRLLAGLALSAGSLSAFGATCDLEVTSQSGFPGGSPTDVEFTFRNQGPDTCSGTEIRMPVNFPGTAQGQFVTFFYNVTSVNILPPLNVTNGFCSTTGDQLTCTAINVAPGDEFKIQIFGQPIANPSGEGCLSAYWHPGIGNVDPDSSDNPHRSCYPIGQQAVTVEKRYTGDIQPGVGEAIAYEVSVVNHSNVSVAGPFIDTPPPGFTFLSNSNNLELSCAPMTGQVWCTHNSGGWPPGTTSFHLVFSTTAASPGPKLNVCTLQLPPGWVLDDSECRAELHLFGPPTATKSGPGATTVGESFLWTINVVNHSTSGTYIVEDNIPSGFTINSVTPTPECSFAGQLVTCALPMNYGDSRTIQINVTANDPGTFTNTCTISGNPAAVCSHTIIVEQLDEADIEVTKVAQQSVFWPGQPINYTISVTNHGPDFAQGVEVGDSLPFTSATWTISAPGSIGCDPIIATTSYVRCWYAGLGVNETRLITLSAIVPPGFAGNSLLNRCQAFPRAPINWTDPNDANNGYDHCRVETPRGTPTVTVAKSLLSPDPQTIGSPVTFRVTLTNVSGDSTHPWIFTDSSPPGFTGAVSNNPSVNCTQAGATVTCTHATGWPQGLTTFDLTFQTTTAPPGAFVNTCTISNLAAGGPGWVLNDAGCNAGGTLLGVPMVQVEKTDLADPVLVGQDFVYRLRVRNTGTAVAQNVSITDPLPAGLQFISVTAPPPFTCVHDFGTPGTVSCNASSVGIGVDLNIDIMVRATAPGTVTNTCQASVDGVVLPDPCDETTVVQNGDIAVVKTDSADPVALQSTFSYTLNVQNVGAGDAVDVTITDPLPAGLEFVSVGSPAPFSCAHAGGQPGVVTCNAASVVAGISVNIPVTVRAISEGTVVNTCTVQVGGAPSPQPNCTEDTTVVVPRINVVKSDSDDPVLVGQEYDYTLAWTHQGVVAAVDARILDYLPMDLQFVSLSADAPFSCAYNGPNHLVECDAATVAVGASGVITIRVLAPAWPARIDNQCHLSIGGSAQDVPECEETTHVEPAVSIIKADLVDPVQVNSPIDYTITLTNVADADVLFEIHDPAPAGTEFVSASGDGDWTCSVGVDVTCSGTVPANGESVLTIQALGLPAPGTVHNVCTATYFQQLPSFLSPTVRARAPAGSLWRPWPAPDCVEDTTVVAAPTAADLTASKTGPSAPVLIGTEYDYQLTVQNHGPDTAQDVVLTDTLPVGTTFVSVSAVDWSCTHDGAVPGVVTCALPSLGVGVAPTVSIRVRAPDVPGMVRNVCAVTSATIDPTTNPACEVDTVIREPGALVAIKSDAADPVIAGASIHYAIVVENTDPAAPAQQLTLTDPLPSGTTFVAAGGPGWSCAHGGGTPGTVTCTRASLAAGESSTVLLEVLAPPAPGVVTNVCQLSNAAGPTSQPGCVEDTTVVAGGDPVLNQSKSASPATTLVGGTVVWTIAVNNTGSATAEGVTVADTVPAGLSIVGVVSSVGSCTVAGQQIACTIGDLPAGAGATVTIETVAQAVGTIENVCVLASSNGAPTAGLCSGTVVVSSEPQLGIGKAVSNSTPTIGEPFDWIIAVTNNGPVQARSVVIDDTMPDGLEILNLPASCAATLPLVLCDLGDLAVGQTATVVIGVRAPQAGHFVNVCTVERADNNGDPVPVPGTCRAEATVDEGGGPERPGNTTPVPINDPVALLVLMLVMLGVGGVVMRRM